jgi:hypothetical protein
MGKSDDVMYKGGMRTFLQLLWGVFVMDKGRWVCRMVGNECEWFGFEELQMA